MWIEETPCSTDYQVYAALITPGLSNRGWTLQEVVDVVCVVGGGSDEASEREGTRCGHR